MPAVYTGYFPGDKCKSTFLRNAARLSKEHCFRGFFSLRLFAFLVRVVCRGPCVWTIAGIAVKWELDLPGNLGRVSSPLCVYELV